MKLYSYIFLLFCIINFAYCKKTKKYNQTRPSAKYDNPNFIRDRYLDEIWKPMMTDEWKNRFRQPFNPAWMDYCDPYHCNDYHKTVCGLNRHATRFKWFQSQCHLILNNMCSTYRGNLRYDIVDTKYCTYYVMYLREGCPSECPDIISPVCAVSKVNRHVVLFKNMCTMKKTNCQGEFMEEYDAIDIKMCQSLMKIN